MTDALPIFGPYEQSFDAEDPIGKERKYSLVPPEDVEAMQRLITDAARLVTEQEARIKRLMGLNFIVTARADAAEKQIRDIHAALDAVRGGKP